MSRSSVVWVANLVPFPCESVTFTFPRREEPKEQSRRDLVYIPHCLPFFHHTSPLASRQSFSNMPLPDLCATYEPFFEIKDDKLKDIMNRFQTEMEEGLADYGKDMAMVPSFVTGVPDGSEEG